MVIIRHSTMVLSSLALGSLALGSLALGSLALRPWTTLRARAKREGGGIPRARGPKRP